MISDHVLNRTFGSISYDPINSSGTIRMPVRNQQNRTVRSRSLTNMLHTTAGLRDSGYGNIPHSLPPLLCYPGTRVPGYPGKYQMGFVVGIPSLLLP
eukprot:3687963-Rhodomonas_salina.2